MRLLASPDSNYVELKEGLEKVGSNSKMGGKKIVVDLVAPYDLISKHRALQGEQTKSPRLVRGGLGDENEEYPDVCTRRESNPQPQASEACTLSS